MFYYMCPYNKTTIPGNYSNELKRAPKWDEGIIDSVQDVLTLRGGFELSGCEDIYAPIGAESVLHMTSAKFQYRQ